MAKIAPFPAVCYNAEKVGGLDKVLTQPYDKISPELQKQYYERSPYNLARIIKGETRENDPPADNVYTRAAGYFREWLASGVLARRQKPALFAYFQQFCVPGETNSAPIVRKGFIGRGRIEEYSAEVIFRHEQTLSAPKADRLELLRATRAHFGQIFMLYSDPERKIDALLDRVSTMPHFARLTDDYGTIHTAWEITDPQEIAFIQQRMSDRKLIIADGHHRYETALNYKRECQASRPHSGEEDCDYVMMTFINMDSDGLTILPTHRVVAGVPEFTRDGFLSRAARYFTGTEYPYGGADEQRGMMQKLRADMAARAAAGGNAIGALFAGTNAFYMLTLRDQAKSDAALAELTPAERGLDVNVLHRIALGLCLGMDDESFRKEKFVTYIREFQEGVKAVAENKAQACFFLNPVRIQQMQDVAWQGKFLPQKSTDFYPKLLSGLTIYQVEG